MNLRKKGTTMSGGTVGTRRGRLLALSGMFFVAYFIVGLVLGGVLATSAFPMPDAPAAQTAGYYRDNVSALAVGGVFQSLSAIALLVFARRVAAFARRVVGERDALPRLVLGFGVLAAGLLLVSALFSVTLVLVAPGGDLSLVGALRDLNFLSGGVAHVVSLGLFVGAASVATSGTKAVPRWVLRLGAVAAVLSILSLVSLVWFPATFLIPLGRLLSFVWCVAVGIVLAFGDRQEPGVG